tara:strand:- start:2207 stop:2440 length:234 start_codon:yes stop_codon:yes gene_type:complete
MATFMRKIPKKFVEDGINECGKRVCLCVEYLNFGKKKDRDRYKHCYITYENNQKYENNEKYEKDYDYEKILEIYNFS